LYFHPRRRFQQTPAVPFERAAPGDLIRLFLRTPSQQRPIAAAAGSSVSSPAP
jgi:hypothetical protein